MLKTLETRFMNFYDLSGRIIITLLSGILELRFGKNEVRRLLEQMVRVGFETTPLAMLVGTFTGMTVALGTGLVFQQFGQEDLIARVVSNSMIREMGPVFTAFIIAARVGASMTAELGTMAVSDEINVLRVLGIRVNRYLVMPRVIAALTMTPALTAYSIIMGILGGAIVSLFFFDVTWVSYYKETFRFISLSDIWKGLFKGMVFGAVYSSVCCEIGMTTTGGAKGVGRATTDGVVISLAGVLVANYVLTSFLFR